MTQLYPFVKSGQWDDQVIFKHFGSSNVSELNVLSLSPKIVVDQKRCTSNKCYIKKRAIRLGGREDAKRVSIVIRIL